MRFLDFRAQGLTSFANLHLDLRDIPPGALVAIVGGNGVGKSTLLDGLFGLPAYLRRSNAPGTLQSWCTTRAAMVESTVAWAGHEWRLHVEADAEAAGGSGRQKAYLYRDGIAVGEGGTDGGITAYGNEITKYFPTREMFLASAFSAQKGTGSFFDMVTPAGAPDIPRRKAFFAELLGLASLQEKSARAHAAVLDLDAILSRVEAKLVLARADCIRADEIRTAHADAETALAPLAAAEALAVTSERLASDAARSARAALTTAETARTASRDRQAALTREIESADFDAATGTARATTLRGLATDEATTRARAAALVTALAAVADARAAYPGAHAVMLARTEARARTATDLERARGDVGRADLAIDAGEKASAGLAVADAKLAPLAGMRTDHATRAAALRTDEETTRATLAAARSRVTETATAARSADEALRRAVSIVTEAERRAGLLDGVPCGGRRVLVFGSEADEEVGDGNRADCGTCRFLLDARAAADGLPGWRADVEALTTTATTAHAEADGAAARLVTVEAADAALVTTRAEVSTLAREIAALAPIEVEAARLRALTAGLDDARALFTDAAARVTTTEAALVAADLSVTEATAAEAAIVARGNVAKAEAASLTGADVRLRDLDAALVELPIVERGIVAAQARASTASHTLAAERATEPADPVALRADATARTAAHTLAEHDLSLARIAATDARSGLDRLRGALAELRDPEARRTKLESIRERAGGRRTGFALVERAFGINGIQALEIDAAGPEIGRIVNQLLETCFGPRFCVVLRTIREATGRKEQREVFDLTVLDGDRPGRPALPGERLSGGEGKIIDEALRLAFLVHNARRHGATFETLLRDEADTGFGESWRAHYPALIRAAMAEAGFRNAYLISHNREVFEQADLWLVVRGGKAWISDVCPEPEELT